MLLSCHMHTLNIWHHKMVKSALNKQYCLYTELNWKFLWCYSEIKYWDLLCPILVVYFLLDSFFVITSVRVDIMLLIVIFCQSGFLSYMYSFRFSSSFIFSRHYRSQECLWNFDTKTRFWGVCLLHCLHVFILQLLFPAPSVWLQVMTEFAAYTHDNAVMSLTPPPLSLSLSSCHCLFFLQPVLVICVIWCFICTA